MILSCNYETSLAFKTNRAERLIDRLHRRLRALEAPTIIIWALTPLVLAAVAAVS
jgi:hypothetical protein